MSDATQSTTTSSATETGAPAHRYTAALAGRIEQEWQDRWESEGTFIAPNPAGPWADPEGVAGREKLYILDMFPYPSGKGLHVGHPLGYIATDVYGRFQRMRGRNVLHALGYDAFGLPAEQFAVQTGQHPRKTTEDNITNMRRQLRRLGLAHDPRTSSSTAGPSGCSCRCTTRGSTRPPTTAEAGPVTSTSSSSSWRPVSGRYRGAARGPT
jgi:leucyl-tRNA synthetase